MDNKLIKMNANEIVPSCMDFLHESGLASIILSMHLVLNRFYMLLLFSSEVSVIAPAT